jgi:tryptophan-rich sensory protein
VYDRKNMHRKNALTCYGIQLILNILWSFIFFNLESTFFAFLWMILLIAAVACTIYRFNKVKPLAAYLMLPYLAWLVFAAILNYSIYIMNK